MKFKIKAKPEGRDGIYLISKEEAVRIVTDYPGKEIHSFLGEGSPALVGADWKKKEVVEFFRNKAEKIALVFEPNLTVKHQLVGLTSDKRYSFDIGEIKKEDLELETQGKVSKKWTMPLWMKKYKDLVGNTGGNEIEDLMNDHETTIEINAPRALLCVAVKSQVELLLRLKQNGLLR